MRIVFSATRIFIAALFLLFIAVSPSTAIESCGGVLRDGDDLLIEQQEEEILAASKELELLGAQPLVMVVNTTGSNNLKHELQELVRTCPVLANDAERAATLIAIGVAVQDKNTAIEVGSKFSEQIDTQEAQLLLSRNLTVHSLSQNIRESMSVLVTDLANTDSEEPQGINKTGLIVGSGLLLITLVLGYITYGYFRRNTIHDEHLEDAQKLRDSSHSLVSSLEENLLQLQVAAGNLIAKLDLSEAEPIYRQQVELRILCEDVLSRWDKVVNSLGTGDFLKTHNIDEVTTSLSALRDEIQNIYDRLMSVTTDLRDKNQQIDNYMDNYENTLGVITSYRARAEKAKEAHVKTSPVTDKLHLAKKYLDTSLKHSSKSRYLSALDYLRLSQSFISDAKIGLTSIETGKSGLQQEIDHLYERHKFLLAELANLESALSSVDSYLVKSNWSSLSSNVTICHRLLEEILVNINKQKDLINSDGNDYVEYENELKGLAIKLDNIESLINGSQDAVLQLQQKYLLVKNISTRLSHYKKSLGSSTNPNAKELETLAGKVQEAVTDEYIDVHAIVDAFELLKLEIDKNIISQDDIPMHYKELNDSARSSIQQAKRSVEEASFILFSNRDLVPLSYSLVVEEMFDELENVYKEKFSNIQLLRATQLREQAKALKQELVMTIYKNMDREI